MLLLQDFQSVSDHFTTLRSKGLMRLLQDNSSYREAGAIKVINTHTSDIKPHGMSLVEIRCLVIYYRN